MISTAINYNIHMKKEILAVVVFFHLSPIPHYYLSNSALFSFMIACNALCCLVLCSDSFSRAILNPIAYSSKKKMRNPENKVNIYSAIKIGILKCEEGEMLILEDLR